MQKLASLKNEGKNNYIRKALVKRVPYILMLQEMLWYALSISFLHYGFMETILLSPY
jgi:hypothetical protein